MPKILHLCEDRVKTNRRRKTAKLALALLVFLFAFLLPQSARAQGGILQGGILVISSSGRPVAGATVTVCSISDNGVPCTATVSLFSNSALTIAAPNPGVTDGNGNFTAFTAAGSYHYTITGNGVSTVGQPFTATVGIQPGGCFSSFNGVSYIGGACASAWGGGDIGAQANAAYAALPSSGGIIKILPSLDHLPYQFSTPILFTTLGKYPLLEGIGVGASQTLTSVTGTVLQYTPTSGDAITLDYVPISAPAWNGRHGISNITLTANTQILYFVTNAQPNTSTSRGIVVGNTFEGCLGAVFDSLDLRGFSTNFFVNNQSSWGLKFDSLTSMFSKHGMHIQDIEQVTMVNPKLLYNLVALETSSAMTLVGGSIDQNGGETSGVGQTPTTSAALVDISGSAFTPDMTIVGTHFEQGQGGQTEPNPMKYVNFASGKVSLTGGSAIDGIFTGSGQNWIVAPIVVIDGGFNAFTGGRTGTIATATITGSVQIFNNSRTLLTSSAGVTVSDFGINGDGTTPTKTFYGSVNTSVGFNINGNVSWTDGAGVPSAGTCTSANGGSLYTRTDGGTTTTLYVCDNSTHTWTAK